MPSHSGTPSEEAMDETSTTSISRNRRASDAPEHDRPSKRPRDDPIRPRVSRACDRCKARKTRCSGTWPCIFCTHLQLDCQFTAGYRRGQLLPAVDGDTVSFDQTDLAGQSRSPAHTEATWDQGSHSRERRESFITTTPSQQATSDLTISQPNHSASKPPGISLAELPPRSGQNQVEARGRTTSERLASTRNSPEPSQTDEQGHYVGPASGVTFLLRIQRKLQVQSPGYFNSSVFNFGDRPLPGHDSSFAILPPKPLAEAMVRRYFDFAAATHRFLHRPSVEAWIEELYETNGAMLYKESARSRTALLFMVFAHSNNFHSRLASDSKDTIAESSEVSARFFAVAEHQLSMEKGEVRLSHIQARLAQCFYLLAQSRLNHCWTLFGVTAHLAIALGLHRKCRVDPKTAGRGDHIDLECRKRAFWCCYNLNTYLSAALGRPMTFHDEDIDQELPLCVDDEQLQLGPSPQPVVYGPSINSATVAQVKLSRILARILRSMYGIRPPSTEEHFTLASKFNQDLKEWREDISYLLDTGGSSAIFVKLVLRQRDVLKLAFWHAQILVHRPFLLKTFTTFIGDSAGAESSLSSKKQEMQNNINTCIDAAINIAEHIDQIEAAGEFYSTLFFIPYYGFSAVVILYVFSIQQRAESPETYVRCFRLASKCHAQIETKAVKGSLMQRYGVVLQELRMEVLRHNDYLSSTSPVQAGGPVSTNGASLERANATSRTSNYTGTDNQRGEVQDDNTTRTREQDSQGMSAATVNALDHDFFNITDWGQFDSLVTVGAGSLDAFLQSGTADLWGNTNTTG